MIRPPTHSGIWYSDNEQELTQNISKFISSAHTFPEENLKALIAPHAGYKYSGSTSGFAYKCIVPNNIDKVFLLGPSHKVHLQGVAISKYEHYSTPLGNITLDLSILSELKDTGVFEEMSNSTDAGEHSLEMHLPILKQIMNRKTNGNFTLIPLLVGSLTIENELQIASTLVKYFNDNTCLFIISSDFCHWGDRFQYSPFDHSGSCQIHEHIEKIDRMGMDLIESGSYGEFKRYLKDSGNTICGRNPILLLLKIVELSEKNYSIEFVDYQQSNKVMHAKDSSVSYAAAKMLLI